MTYHTIKPPNAYEDLEALFVAKDVALEISWDDEAKVGGVFKREYINGTHREFVYTKLANVFDKKSADEIVRLIKHLIEVAVTQNRVRNNY